FRAYRREVLETLPFERFSDDFVFDSQLLVSAVDAGFRIGEIPVPVRYMPEASSIGFRRSVRYRLGTLGAAAQSVLRPLGFPPARIFAPRSARRRSRVDRRGYAPRGRRGGRGRDARSGRRAAREAPRTPARPARARGAAHRVRGAGDPGARR